MSHLWAVTGMELNDPTYFFVHTDDDGLVTELEVASFRSADVPTRTLMAGWEQYEPEGVPDAGQGYLEVSGVPHSYVWHSDIHAAVDQVSR